MGFALAYFCKIHYNNDIWIHWGHARIADGIPKREVLYEVSKKSCTFARRSAGLYGSSAWCLRAQ
jgi:hypothetical protein